MPVTRSVTPRITLIIDTSGSMREGFRLSIAASCVDIVRELYSDHRGIRVITGDTSGKSETVNVKRAGEVLARLVGGGGTNMANIMRQAVEAKPAPQLLIVATDIDTPWPELAEMQGIPVVIAACDPYQNRIPDLPKWSTNILITNQDWSNTL
jgi:predicted metal-dependent peptidase